MSASRGNGAPSQKLHHVFSQPKLLSAQLLALRYCKSMLCGMLVNKQANENPHQEKSTKRSCKVTKGYSCKVTKTRFHFNGASSKFSTQTIAFEQNQPEHTYNTFAQHTYTRGQNTGCCFVEVEVSNAPHAVHEQSEDVAEKIKIRD